VRVAVVHDWLYTLGGAERVLKAILRCFPSADLYCLFDVLDDAGRKTIGYERSTTSFLQRLPWIRRHHRSYLPLMPLAIEQIDLRAYDVVISSSYAVAKGVITGPNQLHISYVHSPMRYAWDLQHEYLEHSGLQTGIKGSIVRWLLHRMRIWDVRTANGVDHYIANSRFVARRIRKLYGRTATVIYPPVRLPAVLPDVIKESFFLTASRLVPYKNVRAIVDAFAHLPDQQLVVVGSGPEYADLCRRAGTNVRMLGHVDDAALGDLMARAAAFIFAAEEDFGIVPVEAQACGTPVIALGRGGARETVITEDKLPTGVFFAEPSSPHIAEAVTYFLAQKDRFRPEACRDNAQRFSEQRFDQELRLFVNKSYEAFEAELNWKPKTASHPEEVIYAAAE
jgi:glycosyltransferase involved in cell wall biosynthesis